VPTVAIGTVVIARMFPFQASRQRIAGALRDAPDILASIV